MHRATRWFCLLVVGSIPLWPQSSNEVPRLKEGSEDAVPKPVRDARNSFFALTGLEAPALDAEPGGPPPPVMTVFSLPMEELPFRDSDVVVVGRVAAVQPYLADKRTALYTEYSFSVDEVMKPLNAPTAQKQVAVAQSGGVVRLNSGRVIRSEVHGGNSNLVLQGKYLLFLKYVPAISCYMPLKGWRLNGTSVAPTHEQDVGRARRGRSAVAGLDEASLLNEARNVMRQR